MSRVQKKDLDKTDHVEERLGRWRGCSLAREQLGLLGGRKRDGAGGGFNHGSRWLFLKRMLTQVDRPGLPYTRTDHPHLSSHNTCKQSQAHPSTPDPPTIHRRKHILATYFFFHLHHPACPPRSQRPRCCVVLSVAISRIPGSSSAFCASIRCIGARFSPEEGPVLLWPHVALVLPLHSPPGIRSHWKYRLQPKNAFPQPSTALSTPSASFVRSPAVFISRQRLHPAIGHRHPLLFSRESSYRRLPPFFSCYPKSCWRTHVLSQADLLTPFPIRLTSLLASQQGCASICSARDFS